MSASHWSSVSLFVAVVCVTCVFPVSCESPSPCYGDAQCSIVSAANAIETLFETLDNSTGLFVGEAGWWNNANAYHAIILMDRYNESRTYQSRIFDMISKTDKHHYVDNTANDDQLWWAAAMIESYRTYGDDNHLHYAVDVFANSSAYWTPICGGGILWEKDKPYKASIANSLFLYVATQLYVYTNDTTYQEWAHRSWNWIESVHVIAADGRVMDGISPPSCGLATDIWTYNSGVLIGALTGMYQISGNVSYLDIAHDTFMGVSTKMVSTHGVLQEQCELHQDGCGVADAVEFKAPFVRYVTFLSTITNNTSHRALYTKFINTNLDSMLMYDTNHKWQMDYRWTGPFSTFTAGRQIPCIDLVVAGVAVNS